jgi:hypothetical protein
MTVYHCKRMDVLLERTSILSNILSERMDKLMPKSDRTCQFASKQSASSQSHFIARIDF